MTSELSPDELETLSKVEASVKPHLDRLKNQDEITAANLEEFRQTLPTEPQLAELLELAFPWPWSELFEYVEASDRQAAHWRVSQDRQAVRSEADLEHKQRFAEAAAEARGLKGTVERDGQTIPNSAAHVADAVSGEEATERESSSTTGERALRRLRELLRR